MSRLRSVEHAEGQHQERVVLRFLRRDNVSEIPYARLSPTPAAVMRNRTGRLGRRE